MKATLRILPFIVLVISLLTTACSSPSPVGKIAEVFDRATSGIEKVQNEAEATKLLAPESNTAVKELNELVEANKDYVLTDDDKALIKESVKRYYKACLEKSAELSGTEREGLDATADAVMQATAYPVIDNATKLGDLARNVPFPG